MKMASSFETPISSANNEELGQSRSAIFWIIEARKAEDISSAWDVYNLVN